MKRILILMMALFSTSLLFAQTKRIAHRSHSGSNKTFTIKGESNFGVIMSREEMKRRDSIHREQLRKDSIDKARIAADSVKKVAKKQKKAAKAKK